MTRLYLHQKLNMEEIEIPTEHLQETIQEKVEEEFKKEEFKILLDYLSPRYAFNGYKIYIDYNKSEKIYIDYNKFEISHEKVKIYPTIKEYEYKHAFVEYPCWVVEQVVFGREPMTATSTNTTATAKLFLEILSQMNK